MGERRNDKRLHSSHIPPTCCVHWRNRVIVLIAYSIILNDADTELNELLSK